MTIKAPGTPMVSVVLSVYNGDKYLSEAIDSIVNQNFSEFELIVINDGSSDQTQSIIDKFKKLDERIISIERENRGLVYSLNEGISISKGEYIVRMDADDISCLNRIREQVEFMKQHQDVGVCGSWIELFSENNFTSIKKHPVFHDDLAPIILFTSPVAHPSTIIRRNVLSAEPYNNKFPHAEDYKLWSELIFKTKFATIAKPLLKYRSHDSNISKISENSNKKERFDVACEIFKSVLKRLDIENTEKEMDIHFSLSLNARSMDSNHTVLAVNNYIDKIYNRNKSTRIFNDAALKKVLIKRFLVYIYFSFKNRKINAFMCVLLFNFWNGIFLFMTRKLL